MNPVILSFTRSSKAINVAGSPPDDSPKHEWRRTSRNLLLHPQELLFKHFDMVGDIHCQPTSATQTTQNARPNPVKSRCQPPAS